MQTYYLICEKHTDNISLKVLKVKNGRPIILPKCAISNKKINIY